MDKIDRLLKQVSRRSLERQAKLNGLFSYEIDQLSDEELEKFNQRYVELNYYKGMMNSATAIGLE